VKSVLLVLVASALIPAAVRGQPATQPATIPLESRPASILIGPLSPPGNGQLPWVGQSIARDLADAIASASRARVDVSSGAPFHNADEARRAAQARGDSVVLFGEAQAAANQVRCTGQILDASTGSILGSLNATAPATNLFPLEDQLAGQILSALPRQWLNAPPATAPANGYASASGPEYQSYVYPDYAGYPPGAYGTYGYYSYPRTYYDYTYAYPSWWWYEPYFWYGPVYYYGYWHHHHFDGDHDWDDHFGRPWRHGYIGPRFDGSRYGPHGPTLGHIGGAGHAGGGHVR
jgi:TolB-like protein